MSLRSKLEPLGGIMYLAIGAALAVVFFFICRKMGYRFFSGVDYSEKVAEIWVPCAFLASSVSTTIVWLLREIPGKPRWGLFVTGLVLLVAWLCGLPRLFPWPITAECILGIIAANAMYYGVSD
jgi:hypothetical protein